MMRMTLHAECDICGRVEIAEVEAEETAIQRRCSELSSDLFKNFPADWYRINFPADTTIHLASRPFRKIICPQCIKIIGQHIAESLESKDSYEAAEANIKKAQEIVRNFAESNQEVAMPRKTTTIARRNA